MATSFNMDKLTLEYFTDKKRYRKYLAKKDPAQSQHLLYERIETYKSDLTELFEELLSSSNTLIPLRPKFEHFVEECLNHIESSHELHDDPETTHYKKEDDETMFGEQTTEVASVPSNPIEFWKAQQILKR